VGIHRVVVATKTNANVRLIPNTDVKTQGYTIFGRGLGIEVEAQKTKITGEGVLKDARNGMIFQILGNGHCKVDITTH